MKEICDKLDKTLLGALPNEGIRFFGFCQLVSKNDQVHPVTIQDNKQVSFDDKWGAICYHRLNGSATIAEDEAKAFGRSTGKKTSQPIRTFVAHKVGKGEDWIYDFGNEIPEIITLTGYDFININEITIVTDHEAIYNGEFGEGSYEKHRIPWNVYALDYSIEFIKC